MRHCSGTRCTGICVLGDAVMVHAGGPRPRGRLSQRATSLRGKSISEGRRFRAAGTRRGRGGGWVGRLLGLAASGSGRAVGRRASLPVLSTL